MRHSILGPLHSPRPMAAEMMLTSAIVQQKPMLRNYGMAGLVSYMLEDYGPEYGKLRLFHMEGSWESPILPHSHRYDFRCQVLAGSVRNRIWVPMGEGAIGTTCKVVTQRFCGTPGKYEFVECSAPPLAYTCEEQEYKAGQEYSMDSSQIHSIQFSPGAVVLFAEGRPVVDQTTLLIPLVFMRGSGQHGEWVPSQAGLDDMVKPWMFSNI